MRTWHYSWYPEQFLVPALVVVLAVSCGGDRSPTRLSRPTPLSPVTPSPGYILSGLVRDNRDDRPIDGAIVQLSQAGTALAVTNSNGRYSIPGLSPANVPYIVHVTKEGYEIQGTFFTLTQDVTLDFRLQPIARTGLSGMYDLTLTSSSACTNLPQEARQRTYLATITQHGSSLEAFLTGTNFVGQGYCGLGNQFGGAIMGEVVSFAFSRDNTAPCEDWPYEIAERLDRSIFIIHGTGEGILRDETVAGTLKGSFSVWTSWPSNEYTQAGLIAKCEAQDHQFTLTQRR